MKKINTFEGIVLSNSKYKDKSSILNILSEDNTIHTVYCHNSNSVQSKQRNIFDVFSVVKIDTQYIKYSEKEVLSGSKVISISPFSLNDIKDNTILMFIHELLNKFQINSLNFNYIEDLISKYKINHDYSKFITMFVVIILNSLGYKVSTTHCVLCGNLNIRSFDLYSGGFLCQDCARIKHLKKLSEQALHSLLNLFTLKHFEQVDLTYINEKNLLNYLLTFLCFQFNIDLNDSIEFLNNILFSF